MPRKWTKAQREAQSLKMKAHWKKKKLAKQPHVKKVAEQPHVRVYEGPYKTQAAKDEQKLHWLERVKIRLGLRQGVDR